VVDAEALGRLTVAQVALLARSLADGDPVWVLLEQDPRRGVRALVAERGRRQADARRSAARTDQLLEFEQRFWGRGVHCLAGVDEVGRGCLAGPVVAAAVVLPPGQRLPGLDDSKKLTAPARERLAAAVRDVALGVGLGVVEAADIDRLNILQATLAAMRQALAALDPPPEHVLVDGSQRPHSAWPETVLVGGDARSQTIAAASVIAKVHRDQLMVDLDSTYPGYGFAQHKGYGSAAHLRALQELGPCPLHRRSFAPVLRALPPTSVEAMAGRLAACSDAAELDRVAIQVAQTAMAFGPAAQHRLRQLERRRREVFTASGRHGEDLAAEYLTGLGYQVLARRYRVRGGEIDVVACDAGEWVFVEVKTARCGSQADPVERVHRRQRARLELAARHFLARHRGDPAPCRFDLITIILHPDRAEIDHVPDAFRPGP
jgi:ribonuclease HII